MKNLFTLFGLILFSIFVYSQNPIRIVSNAPHNQMWADVDGDYVVYESNQDLNSHIYLYKISDSSTTRITSVDSYKGKPRIRGNLVVWEDNRMGSRFIYYYDINQPQLGDRILLQKSNIQSLMDFDGQRLLIYYSYGTYPHFTYKLSCYDIASSSEIVIKEARIGSASMSNHFFVYEMNEDIYLYNSFTNKTTVICNDPSEQLNPVISGRTIVWEDNRRGNWDLYQCNLFYWQSGAHLKDFPLTFLALDRYKSEPSDQRNPRIRNKMLVFTDNTENNNEIYLMNYKDPLMGPVSRISYSSYNDCEPATDGSKIVWWDNKDPFPPTIANADVYLWQRPPGADLELSINTPNKIYQLDEFITFNLTVTNNGPAAAINVVAADTISNKIYILSATSSAGYVTVNNNIVLLNLDYLPPDSTVNITIIGKAVNAGKAFWKASVYSSKPDYILQNNSSYDYIIISTSRVSRLNFQQPGAYPKIKVDKFGFIHIITYERFPVYLSYITNKSGLWTEEIIDNSQGDIFLIDADLDVDNQGNPHICYVISPYSPTFPNMTLRYTYNVSGQWHSTLPLGPLGDEKMFQSQIKIDKNNFAHIAYINDLWSGGQLKYLTNRTGSWSSPQLISNSYNAFSMALDTNSYVHFVTYLSGLGPVYITNSPNGQWQPIERIDLNWTGGQKETLSLDIFIDRNNIPHVSYVGNHYNSEDYKYAYKLNNIWQNMFVDTCSFMGGYNSITVDKNSTPYVLYALPNSTDLCYAKKENNFFRRYLITENYNESYLSPSFDLTVDNYDNIHFAFTSNYNLNYGTTARYTINYGGGDDNSGGYFFANSTASGSNVMSAPTYNWIDPFSSAHSIVTSWSAGNSNNGYVGPIALPFNFSFFNNTYDEIFINSNGYLSFGNGYLSTLDNASIPLTDEPNNIIAACAMDLNLDYSVHPESKLFYGIHAGKFVVTYYRAYAQNSPADYITFQIILYPNGNILIQYNNLESTMPLPSSIANDALIGIENEFGTKGICYRNNGAGGPIFASPLALMFGLNSLLLPVEKEKEISVMNYNLLQNYPNPFNSITNIRYSVPERSRVKMKIFNLLGQEITTLVNEEKEGGWHKTQFNANNLASGVYLCRIEAGSYRSVIKLLLLK